MSSKLRVPFVENVTLERTYMKEDTESVITEAHSQGTQWYEWVLFSLAVLLLLNAGIYWIVIG